MIRINYAAGSLVDTCSFYRGFGPLSQLAKKVQDVSVYNVTDLNWATLAQLDVIMLPRIYNENLLNGMDMCLNNFKPIWTDYDDNLFCVPRSNPSFHHFHGKEAILARAAERAHVITVTTEALYKTYLTYNKNTQVIPNAYDDCMFGEIPHHTGKRRKLLVWRGSNTHDEDLISISNDLVDVVNSSEFSDWKILFVGYNPAYLSCRMKPERVLYKEPLDIIDYFKFMTGLNAALMIVPLVDTEFNRAKSNIAWIEGTLAGASVFADDLPEFRRPGCSVVPKGQWGKTLLEVIRAANADGSFIQYNNDLSRTHIKEHLYLSSVNKLREDLVRNLSRKIRPQS